jgi:hypothetical protein
MISDKEPKIEEIVAEKVFTLEAVCAMLGVDPKTHWVRVVHEITRDAAPWAVARFQAIRR